MSAEQKIKAALTALILDQPFYGALALGLPFKADPTCKTAWVDGRNIGYNPTFIDSLSHDRIVGLVAHEVSHVALGHPWRRDARDAMRWNVATDRTINSDLRDAGFRLPEGVLYASGDEVGKSAEWIYARLDEGDDDQPQQGTKPAPGESGSSDDSQQNDEDGDEGDGEGESDEPGDGDETDGEGDGTPGDGEPGEGDEPGDDPMGEVRDAPTSEDEDGEPAPTEADWKQKTAAAAQMAKAMGKMPAGMARDVAEALKPRIDARGLLLRFFQDQTASDYSWSRPNPRYVSRSLYLPSLNSKALGEIGILCDTSGSMDSVSLQQARGVVEQVIDECNPARVVLYFVDTEVHGTHVMERGESLTWEPKGGGGTSFSSFFRALEESDTQPVCIVGISDLQASFGDTIPSVPVLWITDSRNATAPFGEVVPLD